MEHSSHGYLWLGKDGGLEVGLQWTWMRKWVQAGDQLPFFPELLARTPGSFALETLFPFFPSIVPVFSHYLYKSPDLTLLLTLSGPHQGVFPFSCISSIFPPYSLTPPGYTFLPDFPTGHIPPILSSPRLFIMCTQGVTILWHSNAYSIEDECLLPTSFSLEVLRCQSDAWTRWIIPHESVALLAILGNINLQSKWHFFIIEQ